MCGIANGCLYLLNGRTPRLFIFADVSFDLCLPLLLLCDELSTENVANNALQKHTYTKQMSSNKWPKWRAEHKHIHNPHPAPNGSKKNWNESEWMATTLRSTDTRQAAHQPWQNAATPHDEQHTFQISNGDKRIVGKIENYIWRWRLILYTSRHIWRSSPTVCRIPYVFTTFCQFAKKQKTETAIVILLFSRIVLLPFVQWE